MLMNYERTVKDFGKCPTHAKNQFNFPFISHCVGDQSSFSGPCTDSRYPVICGDGSCKSTYIECLRSLADLESTRESEIKACKSNHVVVFFVLFILSYFYLFFFLILLNLIFLSFCLNLFHISSSI